MPRTADAMPTIHITDIEEAINFWRDRSPSSDGVALTTEVSALAEVYGRLVHQRHEDVPTQSMTPHAMAAWLAWYASTPDTPCIAICSTSQGDDVCKGCGRSFTEVQLWTQMTPTQKRQTWRRITQDNAAWRFNRYAERALGAGAPWKSEPV